MPTKRTLRQRLADLQRRYENVVAERDEARDALKSRKWVEDHLASSHDDLVIKRTKERDAALRLLRTAEDRVAELERRLADRPTPAAELRDARRALMLSERARASLVEQLATLQAANEALYRSGDLAEVTAP